MVYQGCLSLPWSRAEGRARPPHIRRNQGPRRVIRKHARTSKNAEQIRVFWSQRRAAASSPARTNTGCCSSPLLEGGRRGIKGLIFLFFIYSAGEGWRFAKEGGGTWGEKLGFGRAKVGFRNDIANEDILNVWVVVYNNKLLNVQTSATKDGYQKLLQYKYVRNYGNTGTRIATIQTVCRRMLGNRMPEEEGRKVTVQSPHSNNIMQGYICSRERSMLSINKR